MQWTVHHVPKWIGCHKAIVVITGDTLLCVSCTTYDAYDCLYMIYIYIWYIWYVIHNIIIHIYSGVNETKQRELEVLVSCLHNHSANLKLLWLNDCEDMETVVPTDAVWAYIEHLLRIYWAIQWRNLVYLLCYIFIYVYVYIYIWLYTPNIYTEWFKIKLELTMGNKNEDFVNQWCNIQNDCLN